MPVPTPFPATSLGPSGVCLAGPALVPILSSAPTVLLATPTLTANPSTVVEHQGWLELQCSTQDSDVTISWFFQNLPLKLEAHMVLSANGRNLTFISAQWSDSGIYQCEARSGTQSQRSQTLNITVNREALNARPSSTVPHPQPSTSSCVLGHPSPSSCLKSHQGVPRGPRPRPPLWEGSCDSPSYSPLPKWGCFTSAC